MRGYLNQLKQAMLLLVQAGVCSLLLSGCGNTPKITVAPPVEKTPDLSNIKVVHTDRSMITLFDPADLTHHQGEPANWYMHDFAIKDDLQSGRFVAMLTDRPGKFKLRFTFGELTDDEQAAAGAEAKLRLRVINHRLLLGGGDTWPSEEVDHRKFAYDPRWISVPNGDYGVIITALKPGAAHSDYVFQLIRVDNLSKVSHAPSIPKLTYGEQASVVGVNAKGFEYNERCLDVPATVKWAPLSARTMPIPGGREAVELPRAMHSWALEQQQAGNVAAIPIVLSRSPEVGSYGFYLKPKNWHEKQVQASGDATVNTLIRCAVKITEVVAEPNDFSLRVKAIPTASDRLSRVKKQQLLDGLDRWLRASNDPAWLFKAEKAKRSHSDAAMILGVTEYLKLSSKESEKLLPMSNALRVDFLLDRFEQF